MSEHKSHIESENEIFEEAKTHDVRKDENFAAEDVGKDENFAVDDVRKDEHLVEDEVGKDEDFAVNDVRKNEDFAADDVGKDANFVENAVFSDARHDASAEHTQPDIPIETGSALSRTPKIILTPKNVRKRVIHHTNDDINSSEEGVGSTRRGGNEEEDGEFKKKRNSERRRIFNMVKYIIAIVLAERRMKNVEFTFDCEGNGKDIQFIFLIFTVVGTAMTVLQILNIVYQIYYEVKGSHVSKILVHETVETFLFLFFIELSQLLLIMGFYEVCTLDCIINKTEIVIALNGTLSFSKIIWRFSTRWEYCTFRRLNTKKRQVLKV